MRETLDDERIRGAEASSLMENKILKEAFDAAERSILIQMDEVSMRDTDMHTRLILARKTVQSVKRYIQTVIETGQLADMSLKEPNKFKAMFRR